MAKRTKAVVQWAVKFPDGTFLTCRTRTGARTVRVDKRANVIRVRITEIPAKASKRKPAKKGKVQR